MSLTPIRTLDDLRAYLRTALQLEHATMPPYLVALYSIKPGTNSDAAHVIRVVLVEEMLHLTLAANVLNAVGGKPDLTWSGFVPEYPAYLPDGELDFPVSLRRFSPEAIDTFMKIERPARAASGGGLVKRKGAARHLVTGLPNLDEDLHFYSIGDFYAEISRGLEALHRELGDSLFSGDPRRQVTPAYYYSGGGDVVPVTDLASALAALRLITEQGEGHGGAIFDEGDEISHYYRFEQLKLGRYYRRGDEPGAPSGGAITIDWSAVYPILADVRFAHLAPGSALHAAACRFDVAYNELLARLTRAYDGHPEELLAAVGDMFRIKEHATILMRNPLPDAGGAHAAPVFGATAGGAR